MLFPADYYGQRAHRRVAELHSGKDISWQTEPQRAYPDPGWSWPEPPNLISWESIEKESGPTVAILSRLEQWGECLSLLPKTSNPLLKSWLFAKLGQTLDAISTAAKGLSGPPRNTPQWQLAYPLLWPKTIAQESKERHVDPLLVHALIREESRYNPLAQSRTNALGLMQLMPGTAFGVGKRIGVKLNNNSDLFRPETNLKLGSEYLSYTIKRFDNNALLAVASYNGGPNAVATWAKEHTQNGNVDWDVFVEDIPFTETREYVRRVFSSYWNYDSIYCHKK
jgi:soluble lytic murein transglycosylase-like protein